MGWLKALGYKAYSIFKPTPLLEAVASCETEKCEALAELSRRIGWVGGQQALRLGGLHTGQGIILDTCNIQTNFTSHYENSGPHGGCPEIVIIRKGVVAASTKMAVWSLDLGGVGRKGGPTFDRHSRGKYVEQELAEQAFNLELTDSTHGFVYREGGRDHFVPNYLGVDKLSLFINTDLTAQLGPDYRRVQGILTEFKDRSNLEIERVLGPNSGVTLRDVAEWGADRYLTDYARRSGGDTLLLMKSGGAPSIDIPGVRLHLDEGRTVKEAAIAWGSKDPSPLEGGD